MRVALQGTPNIIHDRPAGIVNVRIDPDTGLLAKADNPKAIFEVFTSTHTPTQIKPFNTQEVFDEGSEPDNLPDQLF